MSHHHDLAGRASTLGSTSADEPIHRRIDDLAERVDTVAGAMAAVAATQSELLEQNRRLLQATREAGEAQRQDLAAVLTALAELHGALAAPSGRPAPTGPAPSDGGVAAPLQAGAPSGRDHAGTAPAAVPGLDDLAESIARVEANMGELVDRPSPGSRRAVPQPDLAAVGDQVDQLAEQLPGLVEEVGALRAAVEQLDLDRSLRDTATELRHHTDLALAGTIRVLDERFSGLRSSLVPATIPAPAAGGMGFEAGAVMGAVQAAWSRLEQRLEHDFDQLGRHLSDLERRIDALAEATEAAANRPVVSGEQLRKTASSVKDAVLSAREQRRLRRGPT